MAHSFRKGLAKSSIAKKAWETCEIREAWPAIEALISARVGSEADLKAKSIPTNLGFCIYFSVHWRFPHVETHELKPVF